MAAEPAQKDRHGAPGANWSPLEHLPSDEVLSKLLDTAERRWRADRFEYDHDVRVVTDWVWSTAPHNDEVAAANVIDAANDLAYALGRTRPVVPIPQGTLPTVHLACPVELPGAIMGIGRVPVRKAIQAGARTVDALLEIYAVREGLDHESRRFCYRGWLAGEGRRKPETEDTRRAMAALLLELLNRP